MGEQGSLQVADGHVADVATRVRAHASHSLGREGREGEGKEEKGGEGGDRRGGVAREGSGGRRREGKGGGGSGGRGGRGGNGGWVNINTTNMNPLIHTIRTSDR